MTEEDNGVTESSARELLIDQQLPQFEARTFSAGGRREHRTYLPGSPRPRP